MWHYTVGEVQPWDYAIGAYQNIMDLKAHKDAVYRFAFSPDELTLLPASKDGTIIAWDTTTGNQRFTCKGHQQGLQVLVSLVTSLPTSSAATASSGRVQDHRPR